MLVKSFVSNITIDLSFNLKKYSQCKHVSKLAVYINTMQSPCIAWIGIKSYSKCLRILVTTAHNTH